MGLWNTMKTKLAGKSQDLTQEQIREIADTFDPLGRRERAKQELLQKVAAGVVYELTPEELGQLFANETYQDMLYFMGHLKQFPPEGVNVESFSKLVLPYLEILAFAVFSYEAALIPHLRIRKIKDAISSSMHRQAILMFAASQNRAEDEKFVRCGEALLSSRYVDYCNILGREESGIADEWKFRTCELARTALKSACDMSRTPGIFESICPTLCIHFDDIFEIVPIQMRMVKFKAPATEQNEKK